MVKLHAVRDLGEGVVAGEVADALLGPLPVRDVARDENVALELRIVAVDARAGEGHRDRLAGAGAHDRLARLLRRLQQVEADALALGEDRDDAAPEQFLLAIAQQLAGRGVGKADDPVRRGHEHPVGHAVEDAVQVVLVDGRLAQAGPHALERLLQLTERATLFHRERARVISLADALGTADERVDRALHRAPAHAR